MAHEVETMAYNKAEEPWHGLGVPVADNLTPLEMLKAAGLEWEVSKHPIIAQVGDKAVPVGNKFALVRNTDSKVLDIVGSSFNPVQNIDAFNFFCDFVSEGTMKMETAGSLKGGRRVFALAAIQESFELPGRDLVNGYLLFSNPHLWGYSIDIAFTPVRVVCMNTMRMAMDGIEKSTEKFYRQSHAGKFNPEVAKEALGIAKKKLEQYKDIATFLRDRRMMKEEAQTYFDALWPTTSEEKERSRNSEKAMAILDTQPGAQMAEDSWWNGFNAVTYMTDHVIGRSNDNRLNSAWFGQNSGLKNKALNLAVEMAK